MRQLIHAGDWPAGSRIPTIPQLCVRFGASTITVRQALQILTRDRLLYGGPGRGNFVATDLPDRSAPPDEARRLAVSDPLAMGQGQVIQVLSRQRPAMVPAMLRDSGEVAGDYVRIHKLHLLEGRPLAVMEMYVAAPYYDLFAEGADETRKIAHLLVDHAVPLRRYRQEITIAHADAQTAALLELPLAGVVARLRRWWIDEAGHIALTSLSHYPSDLFLLDIAIEDPSGRLARLRSGPVG